VPVCERFIGTRIVATPAALDAAVWPSGALVFRFAPDEVLVSAAVDASIVNDQDAIVEPETGFAWMWLPRAVAMTILERECDWELPREIPMFVQGLVAGLPVKLWFERDRVLFIIAAPFAEELTERLR